MTDKKFAHGQRSNQLRKEKRERDPEYDILFRQRAQDAQLKRRYGTTRDHVVDLFTIQEGYCAICLEPGLCPTTLSVGSAGKLNVDHCHKTGKIRGLLCNLCNTALGKFRDDADILMRAHDYVL